MQSRSRWQLRTGKLIITGLREYKSKSQNSKKSLNMLAFDF
jgi:hypothetical protein